MFLFVFWSLIQFRILVIFFYCERVSKFVLARYNLSKFEFIVMSSFIWIQFRFIKESTWATVRKVCVQLTEKWRRNKTIQSIHLWMFFFRFEAHLSSESFEWHERLACGIFKTISSQCERINWIRNWIGTYWYWANSNSIDCLNAVHNANLQTNNDKSFAHNRCASAWTSNYRQ